MRRFFELKIALIVIVAAAIVASASLAFDIGRQNLKILQISSNNTAFTGSQGMTELVRLRLSLESFSGAPQPAARELVRLRHSIFMSRVNVMAQGEFGRFMAMSPYRDLLLTALRGTMARLSTVVHGDFGAVDAREASLALAQYEQPMSAVASAANQYAGEKLAAGRKELTRLQSLSAYATMSLVACGALLFAMVLRGASLLGAAHEAQHDLLRDLEAASDGLRLRNRQLDRLAHFDQLTGLANRTLFVEELAQRLGLVESGGTPFTLLLLDLDGFKAVNDSYGHGAGDDVLRQVGRRILQFSPPGSFCARLGGDELAMLCAEPRQGEAVGTATAASIVDALSRPFDLGSAHTAIGVSIGSAFCDVAMPADVLIRRADNALYRAKRQGKGRVEQAERQAA